jgi:osmotically-inducible protein OsmY
MKKKFNYVLPMLFVVLTMGVVSCSTNRDAVIKADLSTKAKEEKDFAAVRFRVESEIVTLSGECATEKSRSTVEATAKGLYGVKDVVNNIIIAPVVIGTDHLLKLAVDSVLKQYPNVEAITKDSIVYLQGKIQNDQLAELKNAINSLHPRMVDEVAISKQAKL